MEQPYEPLQVTYADGSQEVLTSLPDITGLSVDGTYTVLKEKGQNPTSVATPDYGKDLFVDFSQGNANDNYVLHTPTVVGSPTFTGGNIPIMVQADCVTMVLLTDLILGAKL